MRSMQRLVKALDCMNASSAEAARPKVRRAPACELLEGRQLLNAAWTPPQGFGGWDGAAAKADSAHVHTLDANGAHAAGHNLGFPGGADRSGHMAFEGGPMMAHPEGTPPTGVAPSSVAGQTPKAPSAQLQTDFQTLQADEKTLQSEIPSSLITAVKTDQATIQKALSSLTPTQLQALRPSGPPSSTSSSDPTSNLTTALTEAGVSSSQINTITTDMQNLKNAYTTTDPTLQAKISADEAAITKDGGPSMPAGAHGFGMPGMF